MKVENTVSEEGHPPRECPGGAWVAASVTQRATWAAAVKKAPPVWGVPKPAGTGAAKASYSFGAVKPATD